VQLAPAELTGVLAPLRDRAVFRARVHRSWRGGVAG
jgi:hypothetical protein